MEYENAGYNHEGFTARQGKSFNTDLIYSYGEALVLFIVYVRMMCEYIK